MTSADTIIANRLLDNIKLHPENIAYSINGHHTTWREMGDKAVRIASGISATLNLTEVPANRPVRIAINLPRESDFLSCIVASVLLHSSYVPIDTVVPSERRDFILKDSAADFLIDSGNVDALLSSAPLEELPSYKGEFDEAYMIYTSGTTGQPKGVSVPYRALLAFLENLKGDDFLIGPSSSMLHFASVGFDASIYETFGALYYGARIVVTPEDTRHDAFKLHSLLVEESITHCLMPPSLLTIFSDFKFPAMRSMICGGEAIPQSVTKQIAGHTNFRFTCIYGPTEATVFVTKFHFEDDTRWRCLGGPLDGVTCHVVDEDMKPVRPGEQGELLIGGPQLSNGYWNRPDLNEKAFVTNPFDDPQGNAPILYHSGDIVLLNEDGSFDYLGRKDSQVKLHSFRIELGEIGFRIESHPRVSRAYVCIEENGNDKHLVAYVQTADGDPELKDVREYIRQFLPEYMVPTYWNHVSQFKLNANAKIDKSVLVNEAWKRYTTPSDKMTRDEEMMAKCVAGIVGADNVNIDVDLISELGLSSLQIMRTSADLDPLGLHIYPEDIYKYRTIREICQHHLYRICYWFNNPEEHPEKPVLVIISGYTSFSFLYTNLSMVLQEHFNIFVIESYHTLCYFEATPNSEIIDLYKSMIRSVEKKYKVSVITGFCYGGEQALRVAADLWNDSPEKPAAVVIDGMLRRDKNPDHFIPLNWPTISEEQNRLRKLVDTTILETIDDDFHYNGPVSSILCDTFAEQQTITPEEQLTISKEVMDLYRTEFKITPDKWRKEYPDAEILFMPGGHFEAMKTPETDKAIIDCILSYLPQA